MHVEGEEFRLFSRKATDYTALYAPLFRAVLAEGRIRARSCVLDGEVPPPPPPPPPPYLPPPPSGRRGVLGCRVLRLVLP